MRRPAKSFVAGCLLGSIVGSVLLLAAASGAALIFREPLTRMMARQHEQRLKPPALGMGAQANLDWEVRPLEGESLPMSTFQHRPVFLHFWNPECTSCVSEIPSINRLHDLLEGSSMEIVSVVVTKDTDVQRKVQAVSAQFPVYTAPKRPEGFSSSAVPTTFVIDADGRVIFSQTGSARWDDPATVAFLRSLGGDHH